MTASLVVVVVRPEPGLGQTLALAAEAGLSAIGSPLFAIESTAWEVPDAAAFDAIIAGSANAFRHGGAQLFRLSALPVHAVGERTAAAARAAGFRVASVGAGGLQEVLGGLSAPQRILRLAGEQRVALRVPPGIALAEQVVYRAKPLPLCEEAASVLQNGAVVLLHAAEAARHFGKECSRLGIERGRIAVAALAPRIAEAAGEGWWAVDSSAEPSDSALLALAGNMCQTLRQGG